MTKRKSIRQKGKIKLGDYYKELKIGDSVAVIEEKSIPFYFPKRIIGLSGKIIKERGTHKVLEIMDGNMKKQYVIHPINLKKLK
jgi:ribosomal protein L21E